MDLLTDDPPAKRYINTNIYRNSRLTYVLNEFYGAAAAY